MKLRGVMVERKTPSGEDDGSILVVDRSFVASLALFCHFRSHTHRRYVHTSTNFLVVYSHMSGECRETHNTQYLYHLMAM